MPKQGFQLWSTASSDERQLLPAQRPCHNLSLPSPFSASWQEVCSDLINATTPPAKCVWGFPYFSWLNTSDSVFRPELEVSCRNQSCCIFNVPVDLGYWLPLLFRDFFNVRQRRRSHFFGPLICRSLRCTACNLVTFHVFNLRQPGQDRSNADVFNSNCLSSNNRDDWHVPARSLRIHVMRLTFASGAWKANATLTYSMSVRFSHSHFTDIRTSIDREICYDEAVLFSLVRSLVRC